MKKYYKAENEAEARIIVGILAAQHGLETWEGQLYDDSYPMFIGHIREYAEPQILSESDWKTEGYASGGGVDDLIALAKNGFIEVPWKPRIDGLYYMPSVVAAGLFVLGSWHNSSDDKARFARNAVCRTAEEAVAKAGLMLAVLAENEEGN